MELQDPRCGSAGSGSADDEQQEEGLDALPTRPALMIFAGDQDVDDGGRPLHTRLAPAPALRCPQPDLQRDQRVSDTLSPRYHMVLFTNTNI